MITEATIRTFFPRNKQPAVHAAALEAARRESTVTTPRRLCYLMGQIFVETAAGTSGIESTRYRDPRRLDALFSNVKGIDHAKRLIQAGPEAIAECIYANRLGNGPEGCGDGSTFKGAGYIQLTGRANYRRYGAIIGLPLEEQPELAREPVTAAQIAFRYWDATGCAALADQGDVEEITRRIHGNKLLKLEERQEATWRAMQIWR
jgi:putative chitinase